LVVAAHPDDEILGCGGTVARHVDAGDTVHNLIVAEGATSRTADRRATEHQAAVAALRTAASRAAGILGAQSPRFLGLPDNRLDRLDRLDVIKAVEAVVAEVRPTVVYTHHAGDLNVDHRIVHEAVLTACRPLPGSCVRAIHAFETVSSTEWALGPGFRPTRFVEIADTLRRKLDALACYTTEMRPFPHARSMEAVEAQARLRGASIGVNTAEAFEVVREIWTAGNAR
jgi:LmbE family N-acetylglucosaminyl deacetylase